MKTGLAYERYLKMINTMKDYYKLNNKCQDMGPWNPLQAELGLNHIS